MCCWNSLFVALFVFCAHFISICLAFALSFAISMKTIMTSHRNKKKIVTHLTFTTSLYILCKLTHWLKLQPLKTVHKDNKNNCRRCKHKYYMCELNDEKSGLSFDLEIENWQPYCILFRCILFVAPLVPYIAHIYVNVDECRGRCYMCAKYWVEITHTLTNARKYHLHVLNVKKREECALKFAFGDDKRQTKAEYF